MKILWERDGDLAVATWVRDGAFFRQPLTLEEAAMWRRGEWFEPVYPEERQTLPEILDAISATRARLKDLGEWKDAMVHVWPELKAGR